MKNSRDEKIERIERKLLGANRLNEAELRKIVAAPQLFEKINARINAEKAAQPSASPGGWAIFPVAARFKIGFAFGAFLLLFVVAASFMVFARRDFSAARLMENVAAPEIPVERIERIDIIEDGKGKTVDKAVNLPEKVAFRSKVQKNVARISQKNSQRRPARPLPVEEEAEFYPLAFAENLEEAKEDGRVIRVELSRSSLLALGIDPPSADETMKIKTDLLVGSDGVARGIRFIK